MLVIKCRYNGEVRVIESCEQLLESDNDTFLIKDKALLSSDYVLWRIPKTDVISIKQRHRTHSSLSVSGRAY